MSHASATATASTRIAEAAPARPLLVVGRLGHTSHSAALFTLCAAQAPAAPAVAAFTFCAGPTPALFASATAGESVEADAAAEAWI
ncbi:hypothetical protein [Streptomyces sp. NPDC001401]|uniref:hypothetical protein n=1 Tax=Streptomyces sp. NPDC001401 TaxID=3364570 RepID=UPI00367EE802